MCPLVVLVVLYVGLFITYPFYIRYIDDTLVLMNKSEVLIINTFWVSAHIFKDKKVHFLDLLIEKNTTAIFYKDTCTGE